MYLLENYLLEMIYLPNFWTESSLNVQYIGVAIRISGAIISGKKVWKGDITPASVHHPQFFFVNLHEIIGICDDVLIQPIER